MEGSRFEGSQGSGFDGDQFDHRSVPPYAVPVGLLDGEGLAGMANDDLSVDFSEFRADVDLDFISRILMEEDMDEKVYMLEGYPALVAAAEKPFHDILTASQFPVSPDGPPLYPNSFESPQDSGDLSGRKFSDLIDGADVNRVVVDGSEGVSTQKMYSEILAPFAYRELETDTFISLLGSGELAVGLEDKSLFYDNQPIWQFNKGVEEASKFLPDSSQFLMNLMGNGFPKPRDVAPGGGAGVHEGEGEMVLDVVNETRGLKSQHRRHDSELEEGRNPKQLATSSGDEVPKEMYDEILLCNQLWTCDLNSDNAKTTQFKAKEEDTLELAEPKLSNGGRFKSRKQTKKNAVDLRSLLVLCAQSIAADDHLSANEQLKQIRQHSSCTGDGTQRLAHYFADGLEARLAGIGSEIYNSRMAKRRTSAADILKAYHVYMSACPVRKISHVYANQTILRNTRKAKVVHIIDFGIGFGFHWPCLIQSLSSRPSGPPTLRITGVDFPQPGFRPGERLEETGRRLSVYAQEFNLPFEYHSIASKWEDITVEDLDIREGEFLVVTCMYVLKNLADETVTVRSPRSIVLDNIKRMNPAVFIHGVENGAYGSPFFVPRFREALFHFSALFDAIDCNIPREDPQRLFLEREFLGQEVLNVIACEFTERVHRPETYKQWQVRNQRSGFTQLPLNQEILKLCKEKILPHYNKDFLIDTDGKWMLQGWKGRVLYAVSTWRPATSGI